MKTGLKEIQKSSKYHGEAFKKKEGSRPGTKPGWGEKRGNSVE